jgi:hypothetical protein
MNHSNCFLLSAILKRHCVAANRECSQQVNYKINLGIARCGYEPADIFAALLVQVKFALLEMSR